jgi:2-polyprenyl-3-methyl-5-hydroxy-6-metoxy-1,4-benzoquinol methylase
MAPEGRLSLPSTWFTWHDHLIRPGMRVLDLACGDGRHSLAAAARGATVVAWDRDAAKLEAGRTAAAARSLQVDWQEVDLAAEWPDVAPFDAILVFNYLDRERMAAIRELLAPGGMLIMETFLTTQRELGWGPTNDGHLLSRGELAQLVLPLEVVHGREVLEPVDVERWRAVASVVARRRSDSR